MLLSNLDLLSLPLGVNEELEVNITSVLAAENAVFMNCSIFSPNKQVFYLHVIVLW